ncbi:MAG: cytochrome c biogenesis protein/thioredoxin [Deltaproteobacteria bacterium]|nr:cytochrome c biogenesis protein/thioredoxin [Deltaproteobacteria bacterium]
MSSSLVTIFGAGLLTFLSPCVLPLVPIYLASLAGGDVRAMGATGRAQLVSRAALFAAGFVAVFTLMGVGASGVGRALASHKNEVQIFGGVLVLLFGLKLLGVLQIPWLDRVLRADDRALSTRVSGAGALLMGVGFAAAWSPCIGPVLGSVLTYTASTTSSPYTGAIYLAVYGMGIALPLLLTALFADAGLGALRRLRRGLPVFERVLGGALVLVAASLLFGWSLLPSLGSPAAAPAPPAPWSSGVTPTASAPAMLELYAKDCPICREMQPVVAAVTEHCEGKGVTFAMLDVSAPENRHLVSQHRLVGVPTFVFLSADGVEVARLVGKQSQEGLFQALAALRGESCPGVGALPAGETSVITQSSQEGTDKAEPGSCPVARSW